MADIRAFSAIRPKQELAAKIAALPYDVYNTKEAREVIKKQPLSFLRIDRAEINFSEGCSPYSEEVYTKAKEIFEQMQLNGEFVQDEKEYYYVYELIMNGRSQSGIVGLASVDDYLNEKIKKHEKTREDKEIDRIKHVDTIGAQTGPIFLAYKAQIEIDNVVNNYKSREVLYSFTSEDQVTHNVWVIDNIEDICFINEAFSRIENVYIADGHHRAASAVKVGLKRREKNRNENGEYDYFLSVLFPHNQLKILPYNRVISDLNGKSINEIIDKISKNFKIEESSIPFSPEKKGEFGMFLEDKWYKLVANKEIMLDDPVDGLDVSILQNNILSPIFGIEDPRIDNRIGFVGGIRGLEELEKRVKSDMKIAFSMYETSIDELFQVADYNKLMPPKSTWFEPKLRSGIFIHKL